MPMLTIPNSAATLLTDANVGIVRNNGDMMLNTVITTIAAPTAVNSGRNSNSRIRSAAFRERSDRCF